MSAKKDAIAEHRAARAELEEISRRDRAETEKHVSWWRR